jgi:acyl carrier protein
MNSDKFEFVKTEINNLLKKEVAITLDTVLLDIGLDSLDIVELQMVYEETFNVELKDIEQSIKTVADLLRAMELSQ